MKNYDKTKVKVLHIHKSTKGYSHSFVEYKILLTGKINILMMKNFLKRYGHENRM